MEGVKGSEIYVGIDWGTEEHEVAAIIGDGPPLRARFDHDGDGLAELLKWLEEVCGGEKARAVVGIEVPRGPVVEALLLNEYRVYALNPKQLDRFRDRHTVAGSKSDALDAYVLADALRHDRARFRVVALEAEGMAMLRERVRLRDELVEERVRLSNRMEGLLQRYYPQALKLGPLHAAWICELLSAAPSPKAAARLQPRQAARILKAHRIRALTAKEVMTTLRRTPLPLGPEMVKAASEHLLEVIPRMQLVMAQIKRADERIGESLGALKEAPPKSDEEPPEQARLSDAALLSSMVGAGNTVVAGLLAEASEVLAKRDYAAVRALCGTAPVTAQSGKQKHGHSHRPQVHMRYACNHRLRNLMFHWARASLMWDPGSKAYFKRHRERGSSFGHALRAVGDRLLRLLIGVLKSGVPYDPTRFVTVATPGPVAEVPALPS